MTSNLERNIKAYIEKKEIKTWGNIIIMNIYSHVYESHLLQHLKESYYVRYVLFHENFHPVLKGICISENELERFIEYIKYLEDTNIQE